MCKFGIATNRVWKDRDGNTREEVCFVDCTVFGRGAETFNQYMGKGRQVLVEGRLHLDQWTTPEGQKRSKHEVVVENFTFLGGGRAGTGEGAPAAAGSMGSAPEDVDPASGDNIPF